MPLQLHSSNEYGTLNTSAVKGLSATLWGLDADVDKRAAYTVVRSGAGKTTNKIFSCSDYPSHDAAIQAAIDAAHTAGGGAVRVEGQFYEIENEIILKERVWLEGDGLGTRLQFKDGTTWTDKYMFRVDDFCSIRNIQLAGNIANVTGGSAIKIEGTACWFDRIRLYQFHQKGFYGVREAPTQQHPNGKPVHANQFTNLRITGCTEYGILMKDGTADNEYSNIWISNGNTGIRLESGQQEIANLHIWETDQNAMEIAASSSFVWLSNPYIESNKGWGCVIEGRSVTFNGGRIWKNGYDNDAGETGGIKIDGGSKVSVVGTHIHENRGPGIYLGNNANKWSAVGAQFYDPRAEGAGEPVSGDTTVRTQTYAIQCDNTVDYGTIVGCIALPWEHRNNTVMALGNHGSNLRAAANFGYADTTTFASLLTNLAGGKLNIGSDGEHSWSDGTNPADTTLARTGNGELSLSSRLSITAGGTLNKGLSLTVSGAAVERLAMNGAGQFHWSDGTAAADTKLYRQGAGQLRTEGEMLTAEVSANKAGQRRGYAGATSSGPPTTGTYQAGDFITSLDGGLHICTADGTPGTWVTK